MIVRVEAPTSSCFAAVRREFPTLDFGRATAGAEHVLTVKEEEWNGPFDFYKFDDDVDRAAREPASEVRIVGTSRVVEDQVIGVLTRCQRAIDRRNDGSRHPVFDRALARLARVFDPDKPLGLADLRHALDTWQWVLRLDDRATLEAQLAALFHDVERSISEADVRVEHHAPDYVVFKEEHARRGGELTAAWLRELGATGAVADRVADLVLHHEHGGDDRDRTLVNEADALSFFSLNSGGFLDYFGEEHTRRKVRYTLARLGRDARSRLGSIRMRWDIVGLVKEAAT